MTEQTSNLVRTVGFWGLVAMCINGVVGSGVFLLPHESYILLGPFSLWAPLIFAVPVFILVLCFAEAASHFSEPGGAYLYARTAFGDFIGDLSADFVITHNPAETEAVRKRLDKLAELQKDGTITEEIAFVTDISGVCRAGVTDQTT